MRIGIIISRRGPCGLWAFTGDACTMLAAAEINAAGGVRGRTVELRTADAGLTAPEAHAAARHLVEVDGVDAVVGRHPSDVRRPISAGIAGRVPYVYTSMYEGGERDPNVLSIGGTDAVLLGHAVPRLMERRGARRFFVLGTDSLWPRSGVVSAARMIARHGGQVCGARLAPVGAADDEAVLAEIRRSGADAVLTLLLGDENVRFNRAFAAAGLGARMLRLCVGIDETVLYGGGADAHENLYVATTYVAGAAHDGFAEQYRTGFGAHVPPATVFGRSCYEAVHLLATLAQGGGKRDAAPLRERFRRLTSGATPAALPATLRRATGRAWLAEAEGMELRVVA